MLTPLIITDVTRMSGTRVCIAGVNQQRKCIRPILPYGITEDWLYQNGHCIIRPFSRVNLDLLENRPDPPHTEDWLIDGEFKIFKGILEEKFKIQLLNETAQDTVNNIFKTEIIHDHGFYIHKGDGEYSLGTLHPQRIEEVFYRCYDDKWDYRISFIDQADQSYRLSVTDLSFRKYVDQLRTEQHLCIAEIEEKMLQVLDTPVIFLRIGLARNWEKFPDRCFLQITGVYTFPDFLHGRCFADLA
jgi:hypothetical protein